MEVYEALINGFSKLSLIGLGYVGMPLAVEFSKKVQVIGYDSNSEKIGLYKRGIDPTNEVGDNGVARCSVEFTDNPARLSEACFHIVAVPTPVNLDKTPDLGPVEGASRTVGRYLKPNSIVVFESTVYPGVTEEVCIPILERESGLKCGEDFAVGYSPERINPGDKQHTLSTIVKVVSGSDEKTLDQIKRVYELVIKAGVFPVSTIKTAEAIKVVENSQRDINIAFMNELAMVFDRMGIDTSEVIAGMNTKWNALGFRPGLVGGHCIGVDPYYFTYEAEKLGYHSQIILAGRKVNDSMAEFVADAAIKQLVLSNKAPAKSKVAVFGLTFKENCPDCRNSKVGDLIKRLREYGINPLVYDPWVSAEEVADVYGVTLSDIQDIRSIDCLILAVAHECFKKISIEEFDAMFVKEPGSEKIIIDVKALLDTEAVERYGFKYWRL